MIFNVQYQQPKSSVVQPPKFNDNILTPAKVKAVGNPIQIKGTTVIVGANTFRFDRSKEPEQFTISTKVSPAPDACQAVVPAEGTQAAIPQFNLSCVFDAGFASQPATQNQPPGYTKTYTCYNLKPGSRFLAVFSGMGIVNNAPPGPYPPTWFGLSLKSPAAGADTDSTVSAQSPYTNRAQYVLCNSLVGIVPPTGSTDAGNVPVTVELDHCQFGNGVPETCSTVGDTRLFITTY